MQMILIQVYILKVYYRITQNTNKSSKNRNNNQLAKIKNN